MLKEILQIIALCCITAMPARAQLIINEASTDNSTLYNQTKIDYSDFIEIKNVSGAPLNLSGWYLSDDPEALDKWRFYAQTLEPNQIKVLLADGLDYYYWADTFQHTNFKIKNSGQTIYLTNASLQLIDSLYVPQLELNQSVGKPEGMQTGYVYFNQMTPALPNYSAAYGALASSPTVGVKGGFFTDSVALAATCPNGQRLVFTTDGENPTETSPEFPGTFTVAATTPVKYRCVGADLLPGNIVTETYLINESQAIPIISMTTDSINLWGESYGVWVTGTDPTWPGVNWARHFRRGAKIEYFDKGAKQYGKEASIETDGGSSISEPKHTLNVKFTHSSLGSDKINFPTFSDDKPQIKKFEGYKIRGGGNQYVSSQWGGGIVYLDAIVQSFAQHTHVPYSAYRPATFLINGHYWGLYELRERVNEDFFKTNYGIDPDSIAMTDQGNWPGGEYSRWYSVADYFHNAADKNTDIYLDTFKRAFDYGNFIDYYALEIHFQNRDWHTLWYSNNIRMWRDLTPGSSMKYGYIMYDMDASMCERYNPSFEALDNLLHVANENPHTKVFRAVVQNQQFRYDFANRYADLVNLYWQQDTVQAKFDRFNAAVQGEIARECDRWPANSVDEWNAAFNLQRNCIVARNVSGRNELDSLLLNNSGQAEITLDVYPPGAGKIHISTIDAPVYPWTGIYFKGAPVAVQAIANEGFTFSHWDANAFIADSLSDTFQDFFTENTLFRANFMDNTVSSVQNIGQNDWCTLFPNPTGTLVNLSFREPFCGQVDVLNPLGQVVFSSNLKETSRSQINVGGLPAGFYNIRFVGQGGKTATQRLVVAR